MPYSSLESIIERSKESYYLALRRTQGSLSTDCPGFGPWFIFFLPGLTRQKIHLEEKIKREHILSLHIPKLDTHIIDILTEHGRLGIEELVHVRGANHNTLNKHLAGFVTSDTLLLLGKGKATWYALA